MTPDEARQLEPGQLLEVNQFRGVKGFLVHATMALCEPYVAIEPGTVVQFHKTLFDAECVHVWGPGGTIVLLDVVEVERA